MLLSVFYNSAFKSKSELEKIYCFTVKYLQKQLRGRFFKLSLFSQRSSSVDYNFNQKLFLALVGPIQKKLYLFCLCRQFFNFQTSVFNRLLELEFRTNFNIEVLRTRHQFSENYHGGPQRGSQLLFFNWFGVDVWGQPSEFGCWRE